MKAWQNFNETSLPIDLLVWVFNEDVIKPSLLRTYLYLKLHFPNRLPLSNKLYKEVSLGLNINIKTAKVHIDGLRTAKFIGYDSITNILHVRSRYTIVPKAKRKTLFKVKLSNEHLKHFTEFIIAATVACIGKRMKQKAKHGPALTNDDALRGLSFVSHKRFYLYPISLSYIASCLNKSISWVDKYKKKAKRLGYIKVMNNWIETYTVWSNRLEYLKINNIPVGRAKKWKGRLYVVGTDLLLSNIYIHKRKKGVRIRNESMR
ncbi:hypothetical protein A0256_20905 [Mucilaginibacter sp. PAMC 26640]|nr:hypothetical protein A0256_20905 [Mucilaginibacter sp. PAMC 26640]